MLVGNTLYLMRNTELLSVSITDGKVNHSALPQDLQPQQNFGGRGGMNGGGGPRDPRGGGGACPGSPRRPAPAPAPAPAN